MHAPLLLTPARRLLSLSPCVSPAEGFGANDNFEVFFEQNAEEGEAPSKRRRSSGADDDEIELERRDAGLDGPLLLGDASALGADGGFGAAPPEFDEQFDEPFMEEEAFGAGVGIEGVMTEELGGAAAVVSPTKSTKAREAKEKAEARERRSLAKRKMVLDDEIQLSTEQMRKQLADTSSITRNLPAEEAAASKASGPAASGSGTKYDPIFDPPTLPYLPAALGQMAVFQYARPAKRARHEETKAARAAEQTAPEDENAPPLEPDMDEVEAWRSADHAEAGDGVGAALGADESFAARESAGRGGFGEFAEGFDEPFMDEMGEMEPYPTGGRPSMDEADEGFGDFSRELPDVDVTDELDGKGERVQGKGSQGSQGHTGSADPNAWNSRTRKMYSMLKVAFGDSSDAPLSYNAMIATTRNSAQKRKVVAGCFQELLFLTTHGIVELNQKKAYGNILVAKTELFDNVAAA